MATATYLTYALVAALLFVSRWSRAAIVVLVWWALGIGLWMTFGAVDRLSGLLLDLAAVVALLALGRYAETLLVAMSAVVGFAAEPVAAWWSSWAFGSMCMALVIADGGRHAWLDLKRHYMRRKVRRIIRRGLRLEAC